VIEFAKNIKLYPYQNIGKNWLLERYSKNQPALLADDMGLGKTIQVISFLVEKFRSSEIENCLIIVPNSLLANWSNEFNKFTSGADIYIHWGERHGMVSQIKSKQIVISTYSTVKQDESLFEDLLFDLVILDEASLIKNPYSNRTKAIKAINRKFSIAMTGTPFENSATDLWALTDFLYEDFLGDLETFKNEYGNIHELPESKISFLEDSIKPIMLRRKKEDVLEDLPSKIDIFTPLTMSPNERRRYLQLETEIKENINDKAVALKLIIELRKFTSHPGLQDGTLFELDIVQLKASSNKFSHLCSIIENTNNDEKILVFENFVDPISKFTKIIKDYYEIPCFEIHGKIQDRQNVIDEFSNENSKCILFLNPKTAGMGLNIVAANHVVHFSRQWNPALESQATARAWRIGQELPVFVHYLYYEDTIESRITHRLKLKESISTDLIQVSDSVEDINDFYFETYLDTTK